VPLTFGRGHLSFRSPRHLEGRGAHLDRVRLVRTCYTAPMLRNNRNRHLGPGGHKCPCCTIFAPSEKRRERRMLRRVEKQAWKKEVR
jgi:hypothetical protein